MLRGRSRSHSDRSRRNESVQTGFDAAGGRGRWHVSTLPDTEHLEIKLAYLERLGDELGELLYRQQQDIDALKGQLRALLDRVEALSEQPMRGTVAQDPPPHY